MTVIVLALMMAYSIVLLWLGLSVAATSLLATALAVVTVEVVRRVAGPSGSVTPSPAGRAIRAAAHALTAASPDAAERSASSEDDG